MHVCVCSCWWADRHERRRSSSSTGFMWRSSACSSSCRSLLSQFVKHKQKPIIVRGKKKTEQWPNGWQDLGLWCTVITHWCGGGLQAPAAICLAVAELEASQQLLAKDVFFWPAGGVILTNATTVVWKLGIQIDPSIICLGNVYLLCSDSPSAMKALI